MLHSESSLLLLSLYVVVSVVEMEGDAKDVDIVLEIAAKDFASARDIFSLASVSDNITVELMKHLMEVIRIRCRSIIFY